MAPGNPRDRLSERAAVSKSSDSLAFPVVLIAVAGWVDAIGYLQIGQLFVSFMSGNSTQLGVVLGTGEWTAGLYTAALILSFVFGTFAGTMAAEAAGKWRLATVLFIDACLLAVALLVATAKEDASSAGLLMAIAMGLQNAAALPSSAGRLTPTFVTGVLVRLVQKMADGLLGRCDRLAWTDDALLWLAMVAGAVGGAASFTRFGPRSLAAPIIVVLVLAILNAAAVKRLKS